MPLKVKVSIPWMPTLPSSSKENLQKIDVYTRVAPKVIPPILLSWPTMSEIELSSQHSATCCCVTHGSREAVWHNGTWHGSAHEAKASLNSHTQKTFHPLTFIDTCWSFMETKHWMWMQWGSGRCVSAVVTETVEHLHWCRLLLQQPAGFCSSLAKTHS